MKRKIALPVAAVVVVAAVVILAVYLRPQSFADCAGFDPGEVTQVDVHLGGFNSQKTVEFTLTPEPDDTDYNALMYLLLQHQYRPKFPPEPNEGRISALDHDVSLIFSHNGGVSHIYFYGHRTLPFFGDSSDVTIVGMTAGESIDFQQEILDLLLDAAARREAAA